MLEEIVKQGSGEIIAMLNESGAEVDPILHDDINQIVLESVCRGILEARYGDITNEAIARLIAEQYRINLPFQEFVKQKVEEKAAEVMALDREISIHPSKQ